MPWVAMIFGGYLSGSIPFGVLLTRWIRGVDVRQGGSGNIGATNVARVAGKQLGLWVLALDAMKGALPVLVALRFAPELTRLHAAVGLAAFLGHVFPIWLRLHGGKGVATALGVLVVLVPTVAAVAAVVYVCVLLVTRLSSLGSLLAALTATALAFLSSDVPSDYASLVAALLGLMLFTHRGNLARLWRRAERRL